MARTRGKSDLEIFEEDLFFISRRLSKRDHVNPRRGLGVDDGNDHSSEKAQRHEPVLVIREAIRLRRRFLSSQENRIDTVYIHFDYASICHGPFQ